MSRFFYIDNEVPNLAEWSGVVQTGSASITQCSQAAFPERGTLGLRACGSPSGMAFVLKSGLAALQPGQVRYVGLQLRVNAGPNVGVHITMVTTSAIPWSLYYRDDSYFGVLYYNAQGQPEYLWFYAPARQRWIYVVVAVKRASSSSADDGYIKAYWGGAPANSVQNLANYSTLSGPWSILTGSLSNDQEFEIDIDEVMCQDNIYPEPFSPAPPDENPCPQRTLVLYPSSIPEAQLLADRCVQKLGIPRANFVRIPFITAGETLSSYQDFQTVYDQPVQDFFQCHPTLSGRCTCLLVSQYSPAFFMHQGVRYSVTSRLMRLKEPFSPESTNPLYSPDVIHRLTPGELGGLYLSATLDAPWDYDPLDRWQAGQMGIEIEHSDMLYCSDSDYLLTGPASMLRIASGSLPTAEPLDDDAFIWTDASVTLSQSPGPRVAFVNSAAESANQLRTTGSSCSSALYQHGYACAVGSCGPAEQFDEESFFGMLRIGGTFAEAAAVACAHLDRSAVVVGNPFMLANLPLGGFNIYLGQGGPEATDWTNPIAAFRPGEDEISFRLQLEAGHTHALSARAVSEEGLEELSTHVCTLARLDQQGQLLAQPVPTPVYVSASCIADGLMIVGFSLRNSPANQQVDSFEILYDSPGGSFEDPTVLSTLPAEADRCDYELVLPTPSLPGLLAVRAWRSTQPGPLSDIVEIAASTPSAPTEL